MLYGDHIVVAGADEDGSDRAVARKMLLDQANRTIHQLSPLGIISFTLLERPCDRVGLFFGEALVSCPASGLENDQPHWHMGWKADLISRPVPASIDS